MNQQAPDNAPPNFRRGAGWVIAPHEFAPCVDGAARQPPVGQPLLSLTQGNAGGLPLNESIAGGHLVKALEVKDFAVGLQPVGEGLKEETQHTAVVPVEPLARDDAARFGEPTSGAAQSWLNFPPSSELHVGRVPRAGLVVIIIDLLELGDSKLNPLAAQILVGIAPAERDRDGKCFARG